MISYQLGVFVNSLLISFGTQLTNEVHLTLTEWKPIPRIYPMCTTVLLRSAELTSSRTRKLKKKVSKCFFHSWERGAGEGDKGKKRHSDVSDRKSVSDRSQTTGGKTD